MLNPSFSNIQFFTLLNRLKERVAAGADIDFLIDEVKDKVKDSFKELSDLKWALDVSTIVALTDIRGTILYANDKFCEVSKYSREELIGQNHRILNSGYHSKQFFRKMWDTISHGKVWSDEIKNRAKDGSYYWVKTTIIPLTDEQGTPIQYIAFRMDITQGKLAEENFRQALANDFTSLVKALHNFVFKVAQREDGTVVYTLFEGKLAKQIGLTTENTFGRTPFEIFPRDTAEELENNYRTAFTGEKVTYTYNFKGRDLHTTLSPVSQEGIIVEVIGSTSEVTELKKAEMTIRHMAYHDSLTNLPNRRMFMEDLSNALSRAKESAYGVAVVFLDLDRFKQINDTLGHTTGDELIQKVTRRLRKNMENDCKVYRLGGDEFVILHPCIAGEIEANVVARRVLNLFKSTIKLDHHEFFITASMGISVYPAAGEDIESLMKNADTAMYYAKNSGRNAYRLYTQEMNEKYDESLKLELHLRKAIENEELELYYQPKIEIASGKMMGMEALLRWNHPEFGFVSPGKFISIAEETGLIISIGEWVLRTACRQNKRWIEKGYLPLRIAVNVSALQFQQPAFIDAVACTLKETGLNPNYLELEITENSVISDVEESIRTLQKLREMNVAISIDDFGTGYSSLSYLKRFPIDSLKIDQSFIRDLMADGGDAAIVKAVISLAHNIGVKVVAEGVESQESYHFLKQEQCDEVQGYLFSRPVPAERFEEILRDNHSFIRVGDVPSK